MEISIEQFAAELEKIKDEAVKNIEVGINEVAEDLLSVSQQLAPLDEGGLMESGTVEPASKQGNEIVAKVGFNKEYSLRRHEGFYNLGPTSSGKPSVDGMSPGRKYLERPVTQNGEKYVDHIADKMGGAFS